MISTPTKQSRINQYNIGKTLGVGASGKVKIALDSNNNKFAIKIFDKSK